MSAERQIVVRLMHGLGNQMFQYALGRRLAIERRADVVFDASWYSQNNCPRPDRPLALREFDIKAEITFDDRWKPMWIPSTLSKRIRWVIDQHFLPPSMRTFVEEDLDQMKVRGQAFDESVLGVRFGAYLCGYWTSPHYFEGAEDQLRKELVLRHAPDGQYARYLATIRESNSVAIHVRRGDYLSTYKEFGVLGAPYYSRAIARMKDRVQTPCFFLFSDCLPEARHLLNGLVDYECVDLGPEASPAHELSLMASCRHFINANSTFSWWGAWLSQSPDKHVFVPDKWFLGIGRGVANLYLPGWESVPAG
jgi:hypothetical protein